MTRRITVRAVRYLLPALLGCNGLPLDEGYPPATVRPRLEDGCKLPGLQKAHVTVPLAGGLATGLDDKLVPVGRSIEMRNALVGRTGEIVKRFGTTKMSNDLLGTSDTLPQAWAIANYKNCLVELGIVGNHPVSVWSPTAGGWATDGSSSVVQTSKRGPIVATRSRVASVGQGADIAYGSGYFFVIFWEPSGANATFHEVIIDATTGAKVTERTVTEAIVGTTPLNLGVVVVNGYAVFVRDTTASDLAIDVFQISSPNGMAFSQSFATTTGGIPTSFDVRVKDSTTMQIAYVDNTGVVQAVDYVPSTNTSTAWTPKDSAGANISVDGSLGWMQDFGGSGKIALIVQLAATGVKVHWDIPTTGATRQAVSSYTMDGTAAMAVRNVTGHTRGSSATGEFTVLYEVGASPATNNRINHATRTGGAIVTGTPLYRHAALRSKTWTQGGDYYVLADTNRGSLTQITRHVLRVPFTGQPAPLATLQVNMGSGGDRVASVVSAATNRWTTAATVSIRLTGNPVNYVSSDTGVDLATIAFRAAGETTIGPPREAIDNLFVPGGTLNQFDGTTYTEANFAYYPEQPTLTPSAGGGLTASSTYWYRTVYVGYDASGRKRWSQPSIAKSVATGVGQGTVTVAAETLGIVGMTGVVIEVYRGPANGTSNGDFQKVGSVANDTTADSVNFVDTVSDTSLANGEFLYTNGGIPGNDTIPGALAQAVTKTRLMFISADDPQAIWVSNKFVDGQGLRFSEGNKLLIRDDHGDLTGLAAMDDKVIAFKRDAIYVITGDGPDAAGRGGFSINLIALGTGTLNPRSIVETPDGVMFQSSPPTATSFVPRTGIYLVNFGLGVDYIGDAVERYKNEAIYGAVSLPTLNQVRFYTDSRILVYDTAKKVWSTFDLVAFAPAAACAWGDRAVYADFNAQVFIEDASLYTDDGATFTMFVATPWLQLNGLRGYQRFYRAQTVGEYQQLTGTITTVIKPFKDFETTAFTADKTLAVVNPTSGSPWKTEWHWHAKLAALKLEIRETSSTAGIKMTAVVLEYGIKSGLGRVPAANRAA
jgi:hypothetical protein